MLAEPRKTIGAAQGALAALGVNLLVALMFWVVATRRYDGTGVEDLSYHLGSAWFGPLIVFLSLSLAGGVALIARKRAAVGVGVVAGTISAAVIDVVWTFVYLVSQGS